MGEIVALYSRVSTKDQTTANQLMELRGVCERNGWSIYEEYTDEGISGAKGRDQRPGLEALMKDALRGRFKRVVVWSVDRLGRSLKHLVVLLDELRSRRIAVYAHIQGIDTSTPTGELMWNFLSIFSQFERELIRERVKAGLARAKAQGVRLGRPPITEDVKRQIWALRANGMGMVRIGRSLRVGTSQVQRVLSSLQIY